MCPYAVFRPRVAIRGHHSALGGRFTSKACPASGAKVTLSPALAADILRRTEQRARDQQHNLGHLAALLAMLGDEIGTPHAKRPTLEWQELGLRVEYLAAQISQHTYDLARALDGVEMVAGRLAGGPP